MEHEQEKEQRDLAGYGSLQRPAVIMCYHVVDKHGAHRLVSINDQAVSDFHGDREAFERHLGARYCSFELLGSCHGVVDLANHAATLLEDAHELKRRCEELRARHGEMCVEPWVPERLDQQEPDKAAPTQDTTAPDNDPSGSRDHRTNQLLEEISKAIFGRIAPVVVGTLMQGVPAELAPIDQGVIWLRVTPERMSRLLDSSPAKVDLAAAVALCPPGVRGLITCRVDARVCVSRFADRLKISVSECTEPGFRFTELSEPYETTHVLHLVCDPAKDTGHTFVMIEFNGGKFVAKGWLDGETAARCAAEGAKSAIGRPPDFRGTTGKSPR
jgi:hypothetical protein